MCFNMLLSDEHQRVVLHPSKEMLKTVVKTKVRKGAEKPSLEWKMSAI